MNDENRRTLKTYWRLILGKSSESTLGTSGDINNIKVEEIGEMLDFLYSMEYDDDSVYQGYSSKNEYSENTSKKASKDKSNLTVLKWLKGIRKTFPQKAIEKLEKDAIERYELKEMLTDKKVLESLEPSKALLETILTVKEYMSEEVLKSAEKIVEKTVNEIKLNLDEKIKVTFSSLLNRNKSSVYSFSGELDFIKTVNKNLKNFDHKTKRPIFEDIYFYENIHKKNKWNLVLAVDESGSMSDSVLYSSIMASIFAKLPFLNTKLVIFDTEIVDLSDYLDDIVKIMFSVRLGGGTDIASALNYISNNYLSEPSKTIVVLVSDFYDWNMNNFFGEIKRIIESGAKFLGIGALTEDAKGSFDKKAAQKIKTLGAEVISSTPEQLASLIKNIIA